MRQRLLENTLKSLNDRFCSSSHRLIESSLLCAVRVLTGLTCGGARRKSLLRAKRTIAKEQDSYVHVMRESFAHALRWIADKSSKGEKDDEALRWRRVGAAADFLLATMSTSDDSLVHIACNELCDQHAWHRIVNVLANVSEEEHGTAESRRYMESALVSMTTLLALVSRDFRSVHGRAIREALSLSAQRTVLSDMLDVFLSHERYEQQRRDVWAILGVIKYAHERQIKEHDVVVSSLRFKKKPWSGFCSCASSE